ncbi:MAG: hypothetical protein ACE5IK_06190, partial [Acidobacteriota bacterium]
DARELFQEAERIDPDFALAYWGEAMSHNHPLWRQQDRDAALAALERFAPTPAARLSKTKTDRERGYMQAVDVLYGEGDKVARDHAYSDALAVLAHKYPEDLEARAFYALSILGTGQGVRDFSVYMRAAAVAEEVFAANPDHPGAAHYLIHSYDDPVHAPLGLRPARVYAQIAPAASHAQHMISHIFVALGEWDRSVDANVKSFDVSVDRRARKNLGVDANNYHALHWLEYSYLQLGRFKDAREALDRMHEYAKESGSARALSYHAAMRAAYIVETGGGEAPPSIDLEDTPLTGAVGDLFATGYAAVLAGEIGRAETITGRLRVRHDTAAAGQRGGDHGVAANPTRRDLVVSRIMQDSLSALIAAHKGETERTAELFEKATVAEAAMALDFGPPNIVKPSHEAYGEALLAWGRPADARKQFEIALQRAPRRSRSLAGLARAAQAVHDTTAFARACDDLSANWAQAMESVRVASPCRRREMAAR